jgi:hypothetical protein
LYFDQRVNPNPYIEEEQTTQWPNKKSTKEHTTIYKAYTYRTKDRVTWTPLKTEWTKVLRKGKLFSNWSFWWKPSFSSFVLCVVCDDQYLVFSKVYCILIKFRSFTCSSLLICCGMGGSISGTRRVNLVTNSVISHKRGKKRGSAYDKWNISVVICDTAIPLQSMYWTN